MASELTSVVPGLSPSPRIEQEKAYTCCQWEFPCLESACSKLERAVTWICNKVSKLVNKIYDFALWVLGFDVKLDKETLEKGIQEIFGKVEAYEKAIKSYGESKIHYILASFAYASEQEKNFLKQIQAYEKIQENIVEILCGAHVKITDVSHHDNWKDLEDVRERCSSHYEMGLDDNTQYGLAGSFISELLFGKIEESGTQYTWFQLEKTPLEWNLNAIGHLADSLFYVISGRNIGPYGTSEHTDRNPLVIEVSKEGSNTCKSA